MTRLARSKVVIRDLIFASPACCIQWLPLWYHVLALNIRWRWKWFWPISSFPPENFLLLQMMPLVHIWVAAPEEQLDRVTSGLRVERRALLKQANIQRRWRGSVAKIDWTYQRWRGNLLLKQANIQHRQEISSQNILFLRHLLSFCLSQNL